MNTLAGLRRAGCAAALSIVSFFVVLPLVGSELTVLHSFNKNDGATPFGRLFQGQDGRLYGTTAKGGTNDRGVVFAVRSDGTEFQVIRNFGDLDIGYGTSAGVIQGSDGLLYGITGWSPGTPSGALYRMGVDGSTPEVVHAFNASVDGQSIANELLPASDGLLYGSAQWGGAEGYGTVFSCDPTDGSVATLINFGSDFLGPQSPEGRLVEGPDGRLYGTSTRRAVGLTGTVFAMAKDGTGLVVLHDFGTTQSSTGTLPRIGVIVGTDGRLYGATSMFGGGNNTIFSIKTDGSDLVVLHKFNSIADGHEPTALIQGPDGRIYGACRFGGPSYGGTVFAMNADGTGFEVLHFMDFANDGAWPEGGLIFGADGRLYGTNSVGGADEAGTVFALAIEPGRAPEIANYSPIHGRLETPGGVTLAATHAPTSFTFEGLPAWMSYDEASRRLSGVPDAMGDFVFTVTASNAFGSGSKEFTLKVGKKLASVYLDVTDQPADGTPKTASVTTYPEGLPTIVTYNGSTTPPTEIGTYTVIATIDDPTREGTDQRTMQILDPDVIAPYITTQPVAVNAELGKAASFTVAAVGAAPLTYQWQKNYANIPGATDVSYTITNTTFSDEADYRVIVTNPIGSTWSEGGTLRVFDPPSILGQPAVKTVVIGGTVSYTVSAIGTGPFTYQWRRNGVNIAGATDATLTLTNVQAGQGGNYSVVVSNAVGSVTSSAAALTMDTTPRLINVSCRAVAGSGGNTLIVGFYISGTGTKDVLIRGIGPKLAEFIPDVVVVDPQIHLYKGTDIIDSNDDWNASLASSFAAVGAFALDEGSADAALKVTLAPGLYSVHLVNTGEPGEALLEVYDSSRDLGSRLTNVSCRLQMNAGQTVILGTGLIGGSVHVLARDSGPSLAKHLLDPSTAMPNPHLRVYSGTTEVAVNDNWEAGTGAYFAPVGAFPFDAESKDAAIRVPMNPGGYTVHATSADGGSGVILIELYESP